MSHLTFFLARTGADVITVDFDTFEEHNIAGQLCGPSHIGKFKVDAIKEIVKYLCGQDNITPMNMMVTDNEEEAWVTYLKHCKVVCVSFDNIKTRKIVFDKWMSHGASDSLFIDGRMGVQNGEVLTVQHGVKEDIDFYNASLFDDGEIEPLPCTAKATTHCGSLIASLMVAQITNWFTMNTGSPALLLNHQEFHLPINYFNDHTVTTIQDASTSSLSGPQL